MDLIICHTPLQALQFEYLIKTGVITDFELIFFNRNKSKQMLFYYDKLKANSKKSTFYLRRKFPLSILDMYLLFRKKKYDVIYFASIENMFVHFILSFIHFNKVITVDDGTANINKESIYYKDKRSKREKYLFSLLGCKYDLNSTKALISTHYTIYKNFTNIIDKTEYIDVAFDENNVKNLENTNNEANVLLGTIFEKATNEKLLIEKIEAFFEDKPNVYYIPHPREKENKFRDFKLIDGLEIAESKICNLFNNYSKVNVFGFHSTAQVNLADIDGVENYFIKTDLLKSNVTFKYKYHSVEL